MEELFGHEGGTTCATDQVLYNLRRRGIEAGLLPWCRDRGVPIVAYSPLEQGRLLRDRALTAVGNRHRVTTAQIALAWALRQTDMMVIPKAATLEHVRENRAALDVRLTDQDLAELDRAFPRKSDHVPLSCCECEFRPRDVCLWHQADQLNHRSNDCFRALSRRGEQLIERVVVEEIKSRCQTHP